MFTKSRSILFLAFAVVLSILLFLARPTPVFNYDFEQFFPQNDPDLDFYESFKSNFENDNDYLLIALENPQGLILEADFLDQALGLQKELEKLEGIDTLISVLEMRKPIIGVFGRRLIPVLSWDNEESLQKSSENLESFRSELISKDGDALLFLIKNTQNIQKENGDQLYKAILDAFEKKGLEPRAVAGKIQAQGDFVKLMENEFGTFLGLSFLLMLVTLFIIFRTFWGVFVPVVVLLFGVAWAFAIIFLLGEDLDVMSVMQPTIFLIVGLSALIHFFTHLLKRLTVAEKDKAIQNVFGELFFPVSLTVFTTSLGFFSLYFTTIPALKSFGWSTGVGILIIFIAIILITPGILYLIPLKSKKQVWIADDSLFRKLLQLVFKKKKFILLGFFTITILASLLSAQLRINGYLLDSLPAEHPIQQDLSYFDDQFGGSNPLEIAIKSGKSNASLLDYEVLLEIKKLEEKILEVFGERLLISPLSLVKSVNQAMNQGSPKAFIFPTPAQYQRMSRWLGKASEDSGGLFLREDQKSGRISGRLSDLGSWLMQKKRAEVMSFVQEEIDPNLLSVRWTGTAYLIDKGHESVTFQMVRGLGFAFLIVGIVAGFLFKSWRISLILLIPNVIPLIWMLGLMFLLGIEFKLSTAILFSVAFGIAVDDSIHFMTRLRFELQKDKNLLYAIKRTFLETGKAICLTSILLVVGFGLLMLSQFEVTYFTGLLIGASLIFAVMADLLLLPLILLPMKKVWDEKIKSIQSKRS